MSFAIVGPTFCESFISNPELIFFNPAVNFSLAVASAFSELSSTKYEVVIFTSLLDPKVFTSGAEPNSSVSTLRTSVVLTAWLNSTK